MSYKIDVFETWQSDDCPMMRAKTREGFDSPISPTLNDLAFLYFEREREPLPSWKEAMEILEEDLQAYFDQVANGALPENIEEVLDAFSVWYEKMLSTSKQERLNEKQALWDSINEDVDRARAAKEQQYREAQDALQREYEALSSEERRVFDEHARGRRDPDNI